MADSNKSTLKKILGYIAAVLAFVGLYVGGKMLGIDVMPYLAPPLAVAALGWIIYLAQKWFKLKLDVLNNAWTQEKVKEAILYAEEQAVKLFKTDELITTGKDKLKNAIEYMVTKLGFSEDEAADKIDSFFGMTRKPITELWESLVKEIAAKGVLMPPATE